MKEFSDSVEMFLKKATETQLREMIRHWAADVKPLDRHAFLAQLTAKKILRKAKQTHVPSLLQDIANIKSEIEDMSAEEPDWDRFGENDEDSLGRFEEFVEPLTALFEQAEVAFDAGDFSTARLAFEELFSVFKIENEYGQGVHSNDLEDIDLDEARARYLRATYIDSPLADRATNLHKAMTNAAADEVGNERPCLIEIVNIAVTPLHEFEEFLAQWIELVCSENDAKHDAWLREAVILKDGVSGIERLAIAEGKQRPRAYLNWVSTLMENKSFSKAIKAADFALENLPKNLPIRAAIANQMVSCTKELKQFEKEKVGRWLSFEAKPSLQKLVVLFETAEKNQRTELLRHSASVIEEHLARNHSYERREHWERDLVESAASVDKTLLVHAYLLSGQTEKALQLAKNNRPLGWSNSDNVQPLCVAYGLAQSCRLAPQDLPPRLRDFWIEAAHKHHFRRDSYFDFEDNPHAEKEINQHLDQAYQQAMQSKQLSQEFVDWSFKAAETRVLAIVSNNHRGAYDRAALMTAASFDALTAMKKSEDAKHFVRRIRERFPRHSAFQRELQSILK